MNYVCTACNVEKPKEAFYPCKANIFKCVTAHCKECKKAAVKARRAVATEDQRRASIARVEAWALANPDRRKISTIERRRRNPDACRAATLKWEKANPHSRAMHSMLRVARKRNACVSWRDDQAIAEFYQESRRRTLETGIPHAVDHIYPLAGREVCGLHNEFNLQVLTRSENSRKGNRMPQFSNIVDMTA